jgi:uncharacterized protein YbjT (DUF2867 family)
MKTIVIVGATGAMGRSVVKALLAANDHSIHIKCITRDTKSKRAMELGSLHANISLVAGDVNNAGSLRDAFRGAYGVFCNTDYWSAGSKQKEIEQSMNVLEACLSENIEHFVYSSLENVSLITNGRISLPYFDSKAEASEVILSRCPAATILVSAPYFENFQGYALPFKRLDNFGDETYVFSDPMADKPYTMAALDDIGWFANYCFANPERTIGNQLLIASDSPTMQEVVEAFTRVTGLKSSYEPMTLQEFRETHKGTVNDIRNSPDGEFVGNMFQFIQEYGIQRDYSLLREINPQLLSFEAWLRQTAWRGDEVAVQNYFSDRK